MLRRAAAVLAFVALASPVLAADLPAGHCEIFVEKVGAFPSSHGSASLATVVKVGWIGNGETIERVGFYGYRAAVDLGNAADCRNGELGAATGWRIVDPATDNGYTAYGEYFFAFPVRTGLVVSGCRGFEFTSVGAFFVQTNKNTYWLNPALDPAQNFYFDGNGYGILERQVGYSGLGSTAREDLRYYNPLLCR